MRLSELNDTRNDQPVRVDDVRPGDIIRIDGRPARIEFIEKRGPDRFYPEAIAEISCHYVLSGFYTDEDVYLNVPDDDSPQVTLIRKQRAPYRTPLLGILTRPIVGDPSVDYQYGRYGNIREFRWFIYEDMARRDDIASIIAYNAHTGRTRMVISLL